MTNRIPQFRPILHAAHMVSDVLREELADSGATAAQCRVLDVIDLLENPVPARVGEALDLTASAMSQMVKRLRKAQLIEQSRRKEGRAYSEPLLLSEKGEALLKNSRRAWDDMEKRLIEIVGEDALTQMFRTSVDIIEGLGSKTPFPKHRHLSTDQDDAQNVHVLKRASESR